MPASVHGNVLVSYEVLSEERRIVLRTERRDVKPADVTRVVFTGVDGYHFGDDTSGSIVSDVLTVPVEEILREHGAEIVASFRRSGAPGPWAEDLARAPDVLRGRGVEGFVLTSSRGMTGWVLARSAAIVPTWRPLPAPDADTRGIYALSPDGTRTRLDGDGLVVAFGDGRELAIRPSSSAQPDGRVALRSRFAGPGGEPAVPTACARSDTYSCIVVHPGADNAMTVEVEARRRDGGAIVAAAEHRPATSEDRPRKSYFATRGEERAPAESAGYVLDLGEGRVLEVDHGKDVAVHDSVRFWAGPIPTREEWERLRAGGPLTSSRLTVEFG